MSTSTPDPTSRKRFTKVTVAITPESAGLLKKEIESLHPASPLARIGNKLLEDYYRDEERDLASEIAAGCLNSVIGRRR